MLVMEKGGSVLNVLTHHLVFCFFNRKLKPLQFPNPRPLLDTDTPLYLGGVDFPYPFLPQSQYEGKCFNLESGLYRIMEMPEMYNYGTPGTIIIIIIIVPTYFLLTLSHCRVYI